MTDALFRIVPLNVSHDRSQFNCNSEPLDNYFQKQVTQDIRRRVTACFVAISNSDQRIAGYYTLSSASVLLSDLPNNIVKKLPRYPSIPAVRMGRLAVDQSSKRQGLGGALLADALSRAYYSEITAYALVVDAKDESAVAFYRHHGFIAIPNASMTLFLPLSTLKFLEQFKQERATASHLE